jgi:galactonate dehydratase
MKIITIKTFIVAGSESSDGWTAVKPFIFVKIETEQGLCGWGEAYALTDQERSIAQLIEEVGQYLMGSNPMKVRRFAATAYTQFAEKRSGLHFYCAMSALEMALWDIAGKARGLPIYQLLGGACHDKIRLYANFWSTRDHSTEAIVDKAVEMKSKGFGAVKIYPFRCPTLTLAEDLVRRVREAIGPDMDLMIDFSGHEDPVVALQAALRFAQYDPYWVEEPVASHDLENLAHITQSAPVRIVTGERLAGKQVFRDVLVRKAANILNPDIAACGGILAFLEIASMAESFSVFVTPHNYNSMSVAQAAMLQVSALAPNCLIAEYFPYFQEVSDEISIKSLVIENGYATLPEQPGLGIELDESALAKYAYKGSQLRKLQF